MTTPHIHITVTGTPAPQGSKSRNRHGAMYESSRKVKPWRTAVALAARGAVASHRGTWTPPGPDTAVTTVVTFFLARPRGHYGTGRNATTLKPSAPEYPAVLPDVDKVLRATFDALTTAGVWHDDSRVTDVWVRKRYADTRHPGADIVVYPTPTETPAPGGVAGANRLVWPDVGQPPSGTPGNASNEESRAVAR